jgi:hypothetical protein
MMHTGCPAKNATRGVVGPLERAGSSVKVILLIRVVSLLPLTAFVALLKESTVLLARCPI